MAFFSFTTTFATAALVPLIIALVATEGLLDPVFADLLHGHFLIKIFILAILAALNSVPIEHHFAILLNDDCRHLAHDQQFEHVDGQGQYEKELDLLSRLFVLEVEAILVGGEHHGGEHLEHGALQVAEAFELVAPGVRDHVGEHDRERPPEQPEQHDQAANVRDHRQRALDVRQELEKGNHEADKQDQIDGLDVVEKLEVIDVGGIVDDIVLVVK